MYPKERGRTAGRACISCAGTNTTIKPVYSLQRHLDVWHVGASAKNALHCKRLVWSLETAARLPASKGKAIRG